MSGSYLEWIKSELGQPRWWSSSLVFLLDGAFFFFLSAISYLFSAGHVPALIYFGPMGYLRLCEMTHAFVWVRSGFMLFASSMLWTSVLLVFFPFTKAASASSLMMAAAHFLFVLMIQRVTSLVPGADAIGIMHLTEFNGTVLHGIAALADLALYFNLFQPQNGRFSTTPSTDSQILSSSASTKRVLQFAMIFSGLLLLIQAYLLSPFVYNQTLPLILQQSFFHDRQVHSFAVFYLAASASEIYAILSLAADGIVLHEQNWPMTLSRKIALIRIATHLCSIGMTAFWYASDWAPPKRTIILVAFVGAQAIAACSHLTAFVLLRSKIKSSAVKQH